MIEKLNAFAERFEAILCEFQGCVHEGIKPFPGTVAVLHRFHGKGGIEMCSTQCRLSRLSSGAD
jgi:hypothetical protein